MTSRYSSRAHFCLVLLLSVTLVVFITEGPLSGEDLVWAASCPLFVVDFDPVANFSAPAWLETEGRAAPCLSTRRALWHDVFHIDLLIMLMAVGFKCHKQCF